MPIQATRIIKNCSTGEETIETYEIPDPTPEEIAAAEAEAQQRIATDISNRTQQRLDQFAATRRYDSVDSMSKYKDITDTEIATLPVEDQVTVTRYRSECRYLALAASQTWAVLERIYTEVMSGDRIAPTCYDDIEGDLPELSWPV